MSDDRGTSAARDGVREDWQHICGRDEIAQDVEAAWVL